MIHDTNIINIIIININIMLTDIFQSESNAYENIDEDINEDIDEDIDKDTYDYDIHFGYGCEHYFRRCLSFAECCKEYFPCRRCHDDIKNEDVINGHVMDVKLVQKIKCTKCNTEQSVKQYCENCGICFGYYYCAVCRFFDDIDKNYYHCDKCNICRVGCGETYVHCDECNLCYRPDFKHKCLRASLCSICYDDLATSTDNVCKINCGHMMHNKCMKKYLEKDYKCPECQKSIMNMEQYFNMIDEQIKLTKMPEEYDKMVDVYCNDCEKKSNTKFHFYGLKCMECGSYNTKQ